jgi:hypothetical protein
VGRRRNDHLHLYRRVNLARTYGKDKPRPYYVLQCKKIDCTHHIPLRLAKGKIAECGRCHNPFILTPEALELAEPHCAECVVRKNKPVLQDIGEFLKDKGVKK